VELKIKLLLIIILIAIVAAAVFFLTQKKPDEFEIFSNLPTENASVIVQMNLNEKSFDEMSKIIGSILSGGLKEIKGARVGIVLSNDSSGIIIYVGTNMTVSDVLQQAKVPSSSISSKTIGGKAITVVELGIGINSVCLWNEGGWLKILTTQQGVLPYLALSNISELMNYTYELYYKPANASECYDVMQTTYDTKYVREFFQETEEFKKRITVNGEYFGEMRAAAKDLNLRLLGSLSSLTGLQMENSLNDIFNKPLSGASYLTLFGDNDGDYAISISHSGVELSGVGKLPCYNLTVSFLSQTSEIVKNSGKEACLSKSKIQYGPINIEFVSLARQVGAYSMSASAYVKGDNKKVVDYLEGFVFSQNFPGEERLWTDRMSPKVKVFEGSKYSILFNASAEKKPLGGVNVSLYTLNQSLSWSNAKGSFIETVITNSLGEADFEEMPASLYYVEASKFGYTKDYGTVSPGLAYTELYIQSRVPLMVNVTFLKITYAAGEGGGYIPLEDAKVELYNDSALINTSYTNSQGFVDFGNITIDDGKVKVSKSGYENSTRYISESTAMPIGVTLWKSYS
jgi:hypothetical protein